MSKNGTKKDEQKKKNIEEQKPLQNKKASEFKKKKKSRVPWHVDLKWIFGLLATILLTTGLTTFALYRVATNPAVSKYIKSLETENNNSKTPMNLNFDKSSSSSAKIPSKNNKSTNFTMKLGGRTYSAQELNKMNEKKLEELLRKEIEAGNLSQKDIEMLMNSQNTSATSKNSNKVGSSNSNSANKINRNKPEKYNNSDNEFAQQMMQNMMTQAFTPLITDFLNFIKRTTLLISLIMIFVGLFFMTLTIVFSFRWGKMLSFAVVVFLSSLPIFIVSTVFKSAGSVETSLEEKGGFSLYSAIANANFSLFSFLIVFTLFLAAFSLTASLISRILKSKSQPKSLKTNNTG